MDILYIGLHGYAGSGKDTVAKALRLMLTYNWNTFEEFRETWQKEAFKMMYATYGGVAIEDDICYCVAFADQLKRICSVMFGIPLEKFYYNKETGWINIDDFRYTEEEPDANNIVTAEQYQMSKCVYGKDILNKQKWMSLREVLVYVGTYICLPMINKNCFLNGVANTVKLVKARSKRLKYVICTDVRFYHELDFIKEHHGININIVRDGVEQLNNVAEHEFDDEENEFDFVIYNNGTYDELLHELWDLVHSNVIFSNTIINLPSHDNSHNCLRKIADNRYMCCFEYPVVRVMHQDGHVIAIDPSGGPLISIGNDIQDIGKVTDITHDDGEILHWIVTVE
jgi:hypothetical protein